MVNITKEKTIPDIIRAHPQTRVVFDRYGLKGCGGAQGPQETLEFFALVHGVQLKALLTELSEAAASNAPAPVYQESLGDILYKRFFRAGLLVLLFAGAGVGVYTFIISALRGTFVLMEMLPVVQAHANAQIFGWIGLFVMGFAVQGLPRFKYVELWRPGVANAAFILMVGGIALRMGGAIPIEAAPHLAVAGGILQFVAVAFFVVVITTTLAKSPQRDAHDRYIFTSLFAFLLAAALEPVLTAAVEFAPNMDIRLDRTATYFAPFRDLQFFMFAGMMVLGVGQRVLPTAFGFRSPGPQTIQIGWWVFLASFILDCGAWFQFRLSGLRDWVIVSWIGTLGMFATALWIAFEMRGFSGGGAGRSRKFILASFTWLLIATALWVTFPIHMAHMGGGFAHGAYGAVRHAFGAGFLSFMIVGISIKVVPVLRGFDPAAESPLVLPFWLLNAGLAIRVVAQTASDWAPEYTIPAAAGGGMVMAGGFFLYAIHLWDLLARPAQPFAASRGDITADSIVAQVLDWYPQTMAVFEQFGFVEIKNPILRNTIARHTRIRVACSMKNIPFEPFVAALAASANAPSQEQG